MSICIAKNTYLLNNSKAESSLFKYLKNIFLILLTICIFLDTLYNISDKEIITLTRELRSKAMALGNRLSSRMDRHDAFVQAWTIVKAGGLELSVKGVTFGNRQEALKRLAKYNVSLPISIYTLSKREMEKWERKINILWGEVQVANLHQ